VLTNPTTIKTGKRYCICSPESAAVVADVSPGARILHQLPRDAIVVAAETHLGAGGEEFVRISSPAGTCGCASDGAGF